jgi:chromosome segregation ATPase
MFDLMGALLFESSTWVLIAMVIVAGLAIGYWRTARSVKETVKKSGAQLASLQTMSERLGHTSRNLEGKMQRLESMESNVALLSGAVGDARREAHDVEKHVDSLATKSDIAATEVEAIRHRVDAGVSDLKRIDDEIKDKQGRSDRNARHIKRLEHDVHAMNQQGVSAPVRMSSRERDLE